MAIHIYKNVDDLSTGLAGWIEKLVRETLAKHDRFTVALAGGNTPKKLFEVLSSQPFATTIDWKRVHIFWGDERFVAFDDKENNAAMAYETLLNKIEIPVANIHRIRTDMTLIGAVSDYNNILESYFAKDEKSFDLVLLGLGADGHTLSLFDISQNFDEDNYVIHVTSKEPVRISLTPAIVNRASHIAFMVSGKDKAKVLQEVIENNAAVQYPAQLIKLFEGEVEWFLDEEAAGEIR